MTLGTFYAYEHEQPPEPEEPTPPVDDRHSIKWGYNLADLDRLARYATSRVRTRYGDPLGRYEAAWDAIAEHLCTAEETPDPRDLVETGSAAVSRHVDADYHFHGLNINHGRTGRWYAAYWLPHPAPSPEESIVNRHALWQIMPALTDRQRQALEAFAATDDLVLAARAMQCADSTVRALLSQGRKRFLSLWHEGETPPARRRMDKRVGTRHPQPGRITASQLETIRDRYHAGERQGALAVEYGVTRGTIGRLLRGGTKPAPDPEETQ